ncbi:metal-dependent transcriptional regulator [Lutibacter sp. HS1-25]|uniref:metal-dependent transcriptional regulator n=1 Tax=Lutibacter sp. HS1-25 TaxID=2485000 RepID=UPI0010117BCB|nr:metal-dependent transcriptional regulator [Lutibacter sp. HS1-25]RXP51759.1 metal-dependent transcriptional regulator [Lutibacter sp. HS1-25]
MLSQSEENYLKAIFSIELSNAKTVSTTLIAKNLSTKASSVTDMIKKLADKNLVNYEKYKGVKLTSEGKEIALNIVRSHRIWEVFLVDKLNYNWDEVHDLAEQLEHIKSTTLIDKLDKLLGFPKHDPHGDPIPDKNGKIEHHKDIMLSSISIGETCVILGIKDSSTEFLQFLDKHTLQINSKITILDKFDFDNSMTVQFTNGNPLILSEKVSSNIFVNKI